MKYFKFILVTIALIFSAASALTSTDRCGKNYDNQKCDSGLCCSQYGYCGTSEEHCSIDKNCQSNFGKCIDYNSGSGSTKTTIQKIGMINTGPGGDCSKEMSVAWHSPYSDNYVEYTLSSDTSFEKAKKISVTGTFRGEDREFYDSNEKSVTFYSCKAYLENLTPNTNYIYRVGNEKEISDIMRFKTAGINGKFSFAWLADVHTADKTSYYRDNIKTLISKMKNIDFVMFSGDITDIGNKYHQWEYFSGNPSISNYMYATIPGNHDYYKRPKDSKKYVSNKWYIDWAATPKTNIINDKKLDPSNYWFIYNKVLFINIDSTQNDDTKENTISVSKQIEWFKDVVENANGKYDYIIVQQHFSYIIDKKIKYGRFTEWSPIFKKYKVDLALGADSHEYSRSAPLYWTGTNKKQETLNEDTIAVSDKYGTVYMTAFQLDGDSLSKNISNKATFLKDSSFYAGGGGIGGCKIDVDDERIKLSLITRDNDEADTVTISKKSR